MSSPQFQTDQSVIDWLQQIPASTDAPRSDQFGSGGHQAEFSRKRKHWTDHRLLSPPTSLPNPSVFNEDMASDAANKKRKTDDSQDDEAYEGDGDQETPRPKSKKKTKSVSSASQSQHSNSSSAHMVFQKLSIDLTGPTLQRMPMTLDNPDLPEDLADLIDEFQSIGRGNNVVPADLQPIIEECKQASKTNKRLYAQFDNRVYDPDVVLRRQGQGLLDEVLANIEVAKDCDATSQDEPGWNNLVHTPILDLALDRRPRNLVGFATCMHANISARYRIPESPGARVDYSMYLNPANDPDPRVLNSVKLIQLRTPDMTINHTPFVPLRGRPIGVTIETKRQDSAIGKAVLQIGIWQASQWKRLSELAGDTIRELPFLPGIVIEGHKWNLVATTHSEDRTILWTSEDFGNTMSPLGTFKVMAGVRRLHTWMAEVYWPWYKRCVLKLTLLDSEAEQQVELT